MDFILGCNYWASNAGIEMWRQYDVETIHNDLKTLSQYGIKYLRVFPLWRDFQPVKPNFGSRGNVIEYVMENGAQPANDYFLDETMLGRFSEFLDLCDSYGIKLIVGLITGWMSGGLFIPSALYGKKLLTDPLALYFEELFIKGFVGKFKEREAIHAWDLGNECNCMESIPDRFSAAAWTASISNAIHAADPSRPVVSGMSGMTLDGNWRIQDQARLTDLLTTHPYPLFNKQASMDEMLSLRTSMFATTLTKWYIDLGNKPCLVEEIGTTGPMICGDEQAAAYLRLNLFSVWANGSTGLLWWCNHDQNLLNSFPYTIQIMERELGLLTSKNEPKPALIEMKKFADFLESNPINLPKAREDGVCLLTRAQDHWSVSYMTHILAKSIGLNLKFSYVCEGELPDANLYIMPSVNSWVYMYKNTFEALQQKVFNGADLYISYGNAHIQDFEEFVGLKVIDSCICNQKLSVEMDGKVCSFHQPAVRRFTPTSATVLYADSNGNPFLTVNQYGKGRVFFVAAPIESELAEIHNGFDGTAERIYETIFKDHIDALPLGLQAKDVVFTLHPTSDGTYLVAINHSGSEKPLNLDLKGNYEIENVLYGDEETIKPYDACILKLKSL